MQCIQFHFLKLLVGLCAAFPLVSQAQTEAVGYVKTVTGDAWVSSTGQTVKAQPGTAVMLGSRLHTAKAASMGVTFKDTP